MTGAGKGTTQVKWEHVKATATLLMLGDAFIKGTSHGDAFARPEAVAFSAGVMSGLEFANIYPEMAAGLRRSLEVEAEAMRDIMHAAGEETEPERLVVLLAHALATKWTALVNE